MGNLCKHISSVCNCNKFFHKKTLHPLVSVIDFSKATEGVQIRLDCYSIILQQFSCNDFPYGRGRHDFSDGTLSFRAPDQTVDVNIQKDCQQNGQMLVFHPDLILGTTLGQKIKDYTFFKYNLNESLHISCKELAVILQCFEEIIEELNWGVDKYSQVIICNKIELLLNYCKRFYTRQFVTRHDELERLIQQLKSLVDDFLLDKHKSCCTLPCACKFAPKLDLSSYYLNDILEHETGKEFNEFIEFRRIELAKEMLLQGLQNEKEIAKTLGFCTAGRFRQLFIKLTGITPTEYANNS